jgi:hypothetical protein
LLTGAAVAGGEEVSEGVGDGCRVFDTNSVVGEAGSAVATGGRGVGVAAGAIWVGLGLGVMVGLAVAVVVAALLAISCCSCMPSTTAAVRSRVTMNATKTPPSSGARTCSRRRSLPSCC